MAKAVLNPRHCYARPFLSSANFPSSLYLKRTKTFKGSEVLMFEVSAFAEFSLKKVWKDLCVPFRSRVIDLSSLFRLHRHYNFH